MLSFPDSKTLQSAAVWLKMSLEDTKLKKRGEVSLKANNPATQVLRLAFGRLCGLHRGERFPVFSCFE